MGDVYPAEDHASSRLERGWFAADRAVAEALTECDALARLRDMTEEAWQRARQRLLRLEGLREVLSQALSRLDGCDSEKAA